MFNKLGIAGVLGLLFVLAGVALVASENLLIGGGIALVIAGLGLVVFGMVRNLLSALGMGGMV
jgi:hypothetical protein